MAWCPQQVTVPVTAPTPDLPPHHPPLAAPGGGGQPRCRRPLRLAAAHQGAGALRCPARGGGQPAVLPRLLCCPDLLRRPASPCAPKAQTRAAPLAPQVEAKVGEGVAEEMLDEDELEEEEVRLPACLEAGPAPGCRRSGPTAHMLQAGHEVKPVAEAAHRRALLHAHTAPPSAGVCQRRRSCKHNTQIEGAAAQAVTLPPPNPALARLRTHCCCCCCCCCCSGCRCQAALCAGAAHL
jgi:hypothetical protein